MNKRTVKRVKDPKGCRGCSNFVTEENAGRPTTYRCNLKPIEAKEKVSCNDKSLHTEDGPVKYQVFLQPNPGFPGIVLREAFMPCPSYLVAIPGAIADSNSGSDIVRAILNACNTDTYRKDMAEAVAGDLIDACNYLKDVVNLNSELSVQSALNLVRSAQKRMEDIANKLDINWEV